MVCLGRGCVGPGMGADRVEVAFFGIGVPAGTIRGRPPQGLRGRAWGVDCLRSSDDVAAWPRPDWRTWLAVSYVARPARRWAAGTAPPSLPSPAATALALPINEERTGERGSRQEGAGASRAPRLSQGPEMRSIVPQVTVQCQGHRDRGPSAMPGTSFARLCVQSIRGRACVLPVPDARARRQSTTEVRTPRPL